MNIPLPRAALVGTLACLALAVLAISFGVEQVSVTRALADPASLDWTILVLVRGPRVALALITGAALGGSGAALQALFRNPLADPYVLGVSGGSALGATLAIAGIASAASIASVPNPWLAALVVPTAAFAGGLAATAAVLAIARSGAERRFRMLLGGVLINAMAASAITIVKVVVAPSTAQELLRWLTGFVAMPSVPTLLLVGLGTFVGLGVMTLAAPRLNLLALGSDGAAHLGINVDRLARSVLLGCSLAIGSVVSVTGLIGFVGLIVPHALRPFVGADVRKLIPLSAVGGAALLVLCDLGARMSFRLFATELPVGAITALLGGPAFVWLLVRSEK